MKIKFDSPVSIDLGNTVEIEVMPDSTIRITVGYGSGIGVSTFVPAEITRPQE